MRSRRSGPGGQSRMWYVAGPWLLVFGACSSNGVVTDVQAPCGGQTCSGHGQCSVLGGDTAVCMCDGGYHSAKGGLACEQNVVGDECRGVDCNTGGVCAVSGGNPVCVCAAGYHSMGATTCAADSNACGGQTCSGHGTCVVAAGAATCVCTGGFHSVGLSCVADVAGAECTGVGCDGHGRCVVVDGTPKTPLCVCDAGYHLSGSTTCLVDDVVSTCTAGGPSGAPGCLPDGSGGCSAEYAAKLVRVDANTALALGPSGKLFRTADQGTTWTAMAAGGAARLTAGACVSATTCVVVGTRSTILRTTDGGVTWNTIDAGALCLGGANGGDFDSVTFADANVGVASCSGYPNGSQVLRTTDGGITWASVYAEPSTRGLQPTSLTFMGQNTAFGAYYRYADPSYQTIECGVLRSDDAGATWHQGAIFPGDMLSPTGSAALSASTGLVLGFGNPSGSIRSARIMRTTDAASTFEVVVGPGHGVLGILYGVAGSGLRAVAVGDNNHALRTEDGGKTWASVVPTPAGDPTLRDVMFFDDRVALIVGFGTSGSNVYAPVLCRSNSCGSTWQCAPPFGP